MWRFVALLVALVAGVAAAVWYYRAAPTAAAGQRVIRNDDRWLDDLQSRSPKDVERATAELEQRGTAALPVIRRTLQDVNADPLRRKAALKARPFSVRAPPRAFPRSPPRSRIRTFPRGRPRAQLHGLAGGSTLRDAEHADEPIVRREALRTLGKLRERASINPQIVVPLLLAAVKDADATVRQVAVTYLGIVRDRPAGGSRRPDRRARGSASGSAAGCGAALSSYGLDAEPAVKALTKASASDPDDDVKREAARALVHISEVKK